MKLGVFDNGWWRAAAEQGAHALRMLPVATGSNGNPHAAGLADRIRNGSAVIEALRDDPVDLLLDNGGAGLALIASERTNELQLVHELLDRPLASHLIDPITTSFQGLDWLIAWQALQSPTWVKAVWDRAQVNELRQFGVPNVVQIPMAAPDRTYDTHPLDPTKLRPIVSFVGGQNTSYFAQNAQAPTRSLFAGTVAQAVRGDLPDTPFFDVFYGLYGLGEPPTSSDDVTQRATKAMAYFQAKLFFHASLCIRNRDRFVIFLKRHLGDRFHLAGRGWDTMYGLPTAPPFATTEAYFNHFREAAVNINLVNGNAETGLNMRHFEITAAGGFMLCYHQPELEEFFEVGKECAVFHNEKDLIEKINHYLSHPAERIAIAEAGQRRTLSQHLYSHRLDMLLKIAQAQPVAVAFSSSTMWDDFRSLVPQADVVLDCGANVGHTVRRFREAYPKAEIYSFEPVSDVFQELEQTCAQVGAHPIKKAVGDRDETTEIHLTAGSESHSLLGFQAGNPCAKWTRVVGKEKVDVCTLDHWCQQNGIDPKRIDIIKMDVQGAELKALHGASNVLKSAKLVHLEVSFVPIYEGCPLFGDIDSFMTDHGYRRHAVYPSDQPQHWGDALYVKE